MFERLSLCKCMCHVKRQMVLEDSQNLQLLAVGLHQNGPCEHSLDLLKDQEELLTADPSLSRPPRPTHTFFFKCFLLSVYVSSQEWGRRHQAAPVVPRCGVGICATKKTEGGSGHEISRGLEIQARNPSLSQVS